MIDTLFRAPHNATEDEYRRMRAFPETRPLAQIMDDEAARSHDGRWTKIYELYHLRGDKNGMVHALEQIKDRTWVDELTYRDVFSREEIERMARESEA